MRLMNWIAQISPYRVSFTKEIKESETQSRRTVVTGNKPIHINPDTSDAKAEILNLQKLAGMK